MNDEELLIQDPILSLQELNDLVLSFQDQIATLDQRTSNANFGSKIYQTKEQIASKGRFIAGAKEDVVIMDGQHPLWRLWAGSSTPGTAPFRVDKDGNMVATSITLTGYIATGGAAGDVNANSTTISGGKITALSITSSQIQAGAITASKISVGSLSAISADIGTITAGTITGITITGGTIQTSSSGLRIVLDGSTDEILFKNGSTTYGKIFPYVFPQGNGISAETLSADAYFFIQEGTHNSAGIGTDAGGFSIYDTTATIDAATTEVTGDLVVDGDLDVAGSISCDGPISTTGSNDHITLSGNAFLRLKSMSGATADGLSGVQNGCMYYRTDDSSIRVRVGGAWKSVTAV